MTEEGDQSEPEPEEALVIQAFVLPENREVYETLVRLSEMKGMTREAVNTHLFNAGLFMWAERISKELDEAELPEDGAETDSNEALDP
jgi:hypothetical protein